MLFKKLFGYFLQGVLLTVPLAATLFVIFKLLNLIDNIIPDIVTFNIPGLGIILLVSFLTLLGYTSKYFIRQPAVAFIEHLLEKAPLVNTIYTAIKDLVSAFVGKEKRFDQPVLVKLYSEAEVEKLGFITRKDLSSLGITGDKVAVYLPHSYAFSGNVFIVPSKNVRQIDASATDVMKFIVSGGVTTVDLKNKP